jgi:hypothetical protein
MLLNLIQHFLSTCNEIEMDTVKSQGTTAIHRTVPADDFPILRKACKDPESTTMIEAAIELMSGLKRGSHDVGLLIIRMAEVVAKKRHLTPGPREETTKEQIRKNTLTISVQGG